MIVAADDEHERGMLRPEPGNPDVVRHVQVRNPDDRVGPCRLEFPDGRARRGNVVVLEREIVSPVAAVVRVQQEPEQANELVAVLEGQGLPQARVDPGIARREAVVGAEPVESRGLHGRDQVLRCARVELVIARGCVQRREGVEVVHGFDYLQAVPELALERRVQEVAAVQDTHVTARALEFADNRDDPPEAALGAVLDSAGTIGIVQVDEGQPASPGCSRLRGCGTGRQQQTYK